MGRSLNVDIRKMSTEQEAQQLLNENVNGSLNYYRSNQRGSRLYVRVWNPPAGVPVKALAFISHGYTEHMDNYVSVGEALAASGILAFGHDHIGHGLSSGEAAYIESVDHFVVDTVRHCLDMRRTHAHLKMFCVAHSMGGMIALKAALTHPGLFNGLILVGPLIIPGPHISERIPNWLMRPTSYWTVPSQFILWGAEVVLDSASFKRTEVGRVNLEHVTRDFQVQRVLKRDKKRFFGGCTLRLLYAFLTALTFNSDMMHTLQVPFLILHGTSDMLCNLEGSHLLMRQAVSVEDKTIVEFPMAAHQLYLEVPEVRHQARQHTVKWILDRAMK